MIPQSVGQREISENATVVTMKNALNELDKIKDAKGSVLEEAVQKCQNFNAVEKLMLVNLGQAEKGTVYEQFKAEFRQIFTQLEVFEKQTAEVKSTIQSNSAAFNQLVNSTSNDPSKQQFYQEIDTALNYYNEVTNMLHQAN